MTRKGLRLVDQHIKWTFHRSI